ncbi:hypothetical protein BH09PLA1_BH09PLA1_21740 [soil metagenome]
MYLTLRSIPELRDLPKRDRRRLWREAMRDDVRWSDALRIVVVTVLACAAVGAMEIIKPFVTTWWLSLIIFAALWTVVDRLMFMVFAFRLRPVIRRRLGGDG